MAAETPTGSTGSSESLNSIHAEEATRNFEKETPCIIYVANLPPEIDDLDLEAMFDEYGSVVSANIMVDESGNFRGYGFVRFKTKEDADNAISKANGKEIDGKKLFVDRRKSFQDRSRSTEDQKKVYTNVYVGNLSPDTNEEKLKRFFERFGTITNVKIETNNGKSKGYGFINYDDHESAVKAVNRMNGKEWNGKILTVSRAQKKKERRAELKQLLEEMKEKQQGRCLKVKNISPNANEKKLQDRFRRFGALDSFKVVKMNGSVGYAYICFSYTEDAVKAQKNMNGYPFYGRRLHVTLIKNEDKKENCTKADGSSSDVVNQDEEDDETQERKDDDDTKENRKQILGERLFPLVQPIYPSLAEKITGMLLLELDEKELLFLIDHQGLLRAKIVEAVLTLSAHGKKTNPVKNSTMKQQSYHGSFSPPINQY